MGNILLAVLKLKLYGINARLRGRELSPCERQDTKAELDQIERELSGSQTVGARRESCLKGMPADAILATNDPETFNGGPVEREFGPKNISSGQFESKRRRH